MGTPLEQHSWRDGVHDDDDDAVPRVEQAKDAKQAKDEGLITIRVTSVTA